MTVFASSQGAIHPNCFYAFFVEQVDRLCDEISGFVEYGYDLVEQGGIFCGFCCYCCFVFFLSFSQKTRFVRIIISHLFRSTAKTLRTVTEKHLGEKAMEILESIDAENIPVI